jgi:hypothetical protein
MRSLSSNAASMVEQKVTVLCGKMVEESDHCRKLLDLSRAEQNFLMKNDADNLSRNTDKMKIIIEALKTNQLERRRLMKEIGTGLGVKAGKLSIGRIKKAISGELASKLEKSSKDLVETGESLYRVNHNTIYLIKFSLDLLNQQNQVWAELLSENEGYAEKGNKAKGMTYPLLVEEKV